MAIFKPRKSSPMINLASSMDQRSNNEILNIGDEAAKMIAFELENADLFYTASLASRNGTEDLSNGLAGYPVSGVTFVDLGLPYGSGHSYQNLITTAGPYDYEGFMMVASGDSLMSEGTLNLQELVAKATYDASPITYTSPINLQVSVFPLNQIHYPTSGIGVVSGTTGGVDAILHSIALSGNYNVPPYPNFQNWHNTLNRNFMAKTDTAVDLTFTYDSAGVQYSGSANATWKFDAPIVLESGQAYWFRFQIENPLNSTVRTIGFQFNQEPTLDAYAGVRKLQEFYYIGAPASATNSLRVIDAEKSTPTTVLKNHTSAGYFIYDTPAVEILDAIPFISGTDFNNSTKRPFQASLTAYTPYVNTNIKDTTSSWLGQYIPLSFSGTKTIYGGYHYANLNWDETNRANDTFKYHVDYYNSASGVATKTVKYEAGLFEIDATTGDLGTNNIIAIGDKIAGYIGTINFDDRNTTEVNTTFNLDGILYGSPNWHLDRVYSMFDNPVTVSSGNYVYAIRYFDDQDRPYSDFNVRLEGNAPAAWYSFSDIQAGFNTSTGTGGAVTNWNNDDRTFINEAGLYQSGTNFACGLITITNDQAIKLIYDYRVGSDLNQKVIIGQSDKLSWTNRTTPEKENWTVFHTGASTNNDALWSALTFNDLFFAHNYSLSNGQVWDSTYSGNSYEHGKRPTFNASGLTASFSVLPSGTYDLMLATSMESGGFRSSTISGVTITGNSAQWIHISGLNMTSQYPFDLNVESTYVFMTSGNGSSIFYAPTLYDAATASPNVLPQPIANNITEVFIRDLPSSGNDVATTLDPSRPQSYLVDQITTPQFKKIVSFNNYIIGIGDTSRPSTMFTSEILAPTIFGEDGLYCNNFEVDPDNGQNLTGMEVDKNYLLLFKKNSFYRVEATDIDLTPFAIVNVSPSIGCLGIFTTVRTEKGVFGLSQYGPFLATANSIDVIGAEILPWFKTLNHDDLTFAYAQHDQINNVITWSIANNNANESRNFALVYNYRLDSWSIRRGQVFNCAGTIHDDDNFDELWIGDILGEVRRDNVGDTDSDLVFNDGDGNSTEKNIQLVYTSPWMSFDGAKGSDSNLMKLMRFIQFNVETAINSSLAIEVYYDYATTPLYTRVLPINQGNSNKRINLGGQGKIVKFKFYNIGSPNKIKINKILLEYQALGSMEASG